MHLNRNVIFREYFIALPKLLKFFDRHKASGDKGGIQMEGKTCLSIKSQS